ncbi:A-factor receptor protein [Streptomyces sp. YIM 130001]|uniref:ScbR family autoregulator-binding transcription factor n=1 Tax=Streptomyces sp. YIM 130001 TaxID=2259644 RepID=UPI000E652CAE|nr:ScbR family autoregulator-binding transcription factor [Streptomyces sp. YIM 130001]RII06892.1 A-factor receptor protein [Streptomyces sp. YIM 130001]
MSKQERATRTRRALIQSAANLFEECGYVPARLTKISAGAGVSRGALHFHFENKAAVAEAVEQEAARALHHAAQSVLSADTGAVQQLVDVTHTFAYMLRWDVVVRAGFQLNCEGHVETGVNFRQEWQDCMTALVTRAHEEGALADGVSQETLVTTLMAGTTGFEVLSRTDKEWLSRYSLTGFWQHMLLVLASAGTLADIDPKGTDVVIETSSRIPEQCPPPPSAPQ